MSPTTLPESFFDLVRTFPLVPLQSEAQVDAALEVINDLHRKPADEGIRTYIATLGELVRVYEQEHYPIEDVSQGDMIEHLLDAKGVTPAKAADSTGVEDAILIAVMRGRASLTAEEIVTLAAYFHVTPATFLPG